MADKKREMTLVEAMQEIARLSEALINVHKCATAASLALRDAEMDPYPGRIGNKTFFTWLPKKKRVINFKEE
jgi:hypothetical protein